MNNDEYKKEICEMLNEIQKEKFLEILYYCAKSCLKEERGE